jgi:hypothetical protein
MKRECPNEKFANDFAERLKMFGYYGVKVVEKLGQWFVYFKDKKKDGVE